jgi:4-amino-4-deoxy-L-arabinose transferase-like glycosyltransferase
VALGPLTVATTASHLTETLFTFLLTVCVWLWMRRRGVLAGLVLGAATLTRAVCLPMIGVVLLLALVAKVNRPLHLKIALAALVVVLPWTVRNAVALHAFIPVNSIGFGANMLLGTIDVPYGSGEPFLTFMTDKGFTDIVSSAPNPYEAERRMSQLAGERIRAAPLHWLWIRVKQYPRFWIGTGGSIASQTLAVRCLFIAGSMGFWAAALAGMALARRRWRELYPIAFFPILLAATHFTGSGDERYSLGLVPMAAIFAGFALSRLIARIVPPT